MALEGCDATPGKKNSPALPNLLCDMPICTSRYGNSNWLSIEMAVWNCGTVSRRWFHAWNVLKERRSRVSVRHRGEDSRAQIARYCYSFGIYHIQSASAGVICIWKTTLLTLLSSSRHARANNRWNYGTIYIFLYMCVCVCVCVCLSFYSVLWNRMIGVDFTGEIWIMKAADSTVTLGHRWRSLTCLLLQLL